MVRILGIDLAWGYRNQDGVYSIEIENGNAYVNEIGLVRGSVALKDWVQNYTKNSSMMAMLILYALIQTDQGRLIDSAT